MKETEKGKKLTDLHTDKTVKENSELLDQRQASNQRKDSFPPDIMKPFAESFALVPSVLCPTWHPFVTNRNEMLAVAKPA